MVSWLVCQSVGWSVSRSHYFMVSYQAKQRVQLASLPLPTTPFLRFLIYCQIFLHPLQKLRLAMRNTHTKFEVPSWSPTITNRNFSESEIKWHFGLRLDNWKLQWAHLRLKWANSGLKCANLGLRWAKWELRKANLGLRWANGVSNGPTWGSNGPTPRSNVPTWCSNMPTCKSDGQLEAQMGQLRAQMGQLKVQMGQLHNINSIYLPLNEQCNLQCSKSSKRD